MRERSDEKVIGVMAHIMDSNHEHHDGLDGLVALKNWHVDEKGWSDIGYHFFIDSTGYIHRCRSIDYSGAHCPKNNANTNYIGICFFGKSGEVTEKQWLSFCDITKELQVFRFENLEDVKQHSDFDPVRRKYCAGIPQEWIDNLIKELA